jgi:hypothetical protein
MATSRLSDTAQHKELATMAMAMAMATISDEGQKRDYQITRQAAHHNH